jgi:mRNA interferase MazF
MATTRRRGKASDWPKRGEIYLTALDPTIGHEIRKTRPALVIQNDILNEHLATTTVAAITSKVRFPISPVHVLLEANQSTGLAAPSVAVFSQLRTVDRRRFVKRLGAMDAETMRQVDEAIMTSLGIAP